MSVETRGTSDSLELVSLVSQVDVSHLCGCWGTTYSTRAEIVLTAELLLQPLLPSFKAREA